MYDESEKPHALVCTEVWGGNRKVIRTLKLPSLQAAIHSAGYGGVLREARPNLRRSFGWKSVNSCMVGNAELNPCGSCTERPKAA